MGDVKRSPRILLRDEALKLLVLGDIHSNHTALKQVLKDAGSWDMALCLGDIVGYGPDPGECISEVKMRGFRCVAGNHDAAVASGETWGFNPYAAAAVQINRRRLGLDAVRWLGDLPSHLSLEVEGVRIALYHGSPRDPLNEYVFPHEAYVLAERLLRMAEADILLLGHTHIPYLIRVDGRYLVNPGSVGQPRDGDPRASYMLLEVEGREVSIHHRRVEYDIDEVAGRMRRLGLPEFLASRLYHGY